MLDGRETTMCFIEYNWMVGEWKFRIGERFTDFRGVRSWASLKDAKRYFKQWGIELRKTDSRTWKLEDMK